MRHIRSAFLLPLLVSLPLPAAADYLYAAFQDASKPYVMIVADTSGSMFTTHDAPVFGVCPYGGTTGACNVRADAMQDVLVELVGRLDGAGLGLIHFEDTPLATCSSKGCGVKWVASPDGTSYDDTRDQRVVLSEAIANLPRGGNAYAPIAASLAEAKTRLAAIAAEDPYFYCRPYYVIVLADGPESCCGDAVAAAAALRSVAVTKKSNLDVRTFVIGIGKDVAQSGALDPLARAGGTSRADGTWSCWNPHGTGNSTAACSTGKALYATSTLELRKAVETVMSAINAGIYTTMAPVIGTAPQVTSEVDAVARNFMVYTAFQNPGYEGHVYGIRLFQEAEDDDGKRLGSWEFTDFTEMDLDDCGSDGNACVYDGGKRLYDRVRTTGNPRKIFTGSLGSIQRWDENGAATADTRKGLTVRMNRTPAWLPDNDVGAAKLRDVAVGFSSLDPMAGFFLHADTQLRPIHPEIITRLRNLIGFDDTQRKQILGWLHGRPSLRSWPLGDPYHAGAAMAEPPPYQYRSFGYPQFQLAIRSRPYMVYVPANDGMIHAFHTGPDLEMMRKVGREEPTCTDPERWCPGDEAWAYLPASMIARTAFEVQGGAQRFFSMDLSCRIDDVMVVDNRVDTGGYDCDKDTADPELCGWRTVLLCGQGWGGNWYVALDVSRPLEPHPLWEMTYDDGANGFGRTWSLPGIALLEIDGRPRWVAVAGNGYNTDLKDSNNRVYSAYRYLNFPFAGTFAHHGNGSSGDAAHVYAFDVATGQILRRWSTGGLGAVVADVPAVDVDRDGLTEVAYIGGWSGDIGRVAFGGADGTRPAASRNDWSYCARLFEFGGGNPVPNRPAVMLDPLVNERVYLIAASGRDKGPFPDEARNEPASYDLDGWFFTDTGGTSCSSTTAKGGNGNMCKTNTGIRMNGLFNQGQGKRRLMGAPILAGQENGSRWLSFTAWDPPSNPCGGDGEGALYCLEFSTDPASCTFCGDLNDDGSTDGDDESIVFSDAIPPPPNSADGQIYVVDDGVIRVANQDGQSGGVGGGEARPNQQAPRRLVVSWREVFPAPAAAASP
jgi:type IV pilus assembly protein PilY1